MNSGKFHQIPTDFFWYQSYHLVRQLSLAWSIISLINYLHWLVPKSSLNLSLSDSRHRSEPWKQGKSRPEIIVISTNEMISSAWSRNARKPLVMSLRNFWNHLEFVPPITSTYSLVNLKVTDSKFILPGELERRKPKSTCTTWPFESSKILPLCLSLICKM